MENVQNRAYYSMTDALILFIIVVADEDWAKLLKLYQCSIMNWLIYILYFTRELKKKEVT